MAITYSLARAGTQLGQFTLEQIRDGLKSGQFAWTDNYWKAGMATWGSLSSLAGEIQAINHAVSPAASSAPTGAAHVSPASASPVAAASPKLASEADGPPRCTAVV